MSSNARRPRASLSTTTAEPGVGKTIHIDVNPSHAVEIDGALVARGLGLAVPEFRQLMDRRQITVLCERGTGEDARSEEHTSELQSLMRISYAVFSLKKKKKNQ